MNKFYKGKPSKLVKVHHFSGGGAVMRSESTESARAFKDHSDALDDQYAAEKRMKKLDKEKPLAYSGRAIASADVRLMKKRSEEARDKLGETVSRTAHYSAGLPSEYGKGEMERFRRDYGTDDE